MLRDIAGCCYRNRWYSFNKLKSVLLALATAANRESDGCDVWAERLGGPRPGSPRTWGRAGPTDNARWFLGFLPHWFPVVLFGSQEPCFYWFPGSLV